MDLLHIFNILKWFLVTNRWAMNCFITSKPTLSKLTSKSRLTSSTERWNVGLISEYVPRFILNADGYRAETHKNRKLDYRIALIFKKLAGTLSDMACLWVGRWLSKHRYITAQILCRCDRIWLQLCRVADAPVFVSDSGWSIHRWHICTHRGEVLVTTLKVSVWMCSKATTQWSEVLRYDWNETALSCCCYISVMRYQEFNNSQEAMTRGSSTWSHRPLTLK